VFGGPRYSTVSEHAVPPTEVQFEYIDSGTGAGACTSETDWMRENPQPEDNDGRSPTRTGFDARDVPGKYPPWQKHRSIEEKRSWTKMELWQDGVASDISRGGQNWGADKTRWVETFGTQLDATSHQIERAKHILSDIDIGSYTRRSTAKTTITTELVIVGILSLLIDTDLPSGPRAPPETFEKRTLARDGAVDLLSDLGHTTREYQNVRKLLRREIF